VAVCAFEAVIEVAVGVDQWFMPDGEGGWARAFARRRRRDGTLHDQVVGRELSKTATSGGMEQRSAQREGRCPQGLVSFTSFVCDAHAVVVCGVGVVRAEVFQGPAAGLDRAGWYAAVCAWAVHRP